MSLLTNPAAILVSLSSSVIARGEIETGRKRRRAGKRESEIKKEERGGRAKEINKKMR